MKSKLKLDYLERLLIVIPVRNEEKYIQRCLESVLDFDVPEEVNVDIAVIDGMSTDNTLQIVRTICSVHTNIRVILNPEIYQGPGLNKVIMDTKCDWVMRLDAHSYYPEEYLRLCYKTALDTDSDNCGGVVNTKAGNSTYSAKLVQALTTHKFGVGNSGFRTSMVQGPADTVPFGFFKRKIFDDIGYFNERLVRAQDYEYNRRILKYGGKIWFNPEIKITYFNQSSFPKFIRKQLFKEAPYNAYMWYLAPYTFAYRHAITGVFSLGIVIGLILSSIFQVIYYIYFSVLVLYLSLAIISSIQQAKRYRLYLHVVFLPIGFLIFHFTHGLGLLGGVMKLLLGVAPVQKDTDKTGDENAYG